MTHHDKAAFNLGYLIACCNLANLHNEPAMASDILFEAGISEEEVKAMYLCEYDAAALAEIVKARPVHPLTRDSQ